MAFCANCGAQLTAGANNCPACGKPAGQAAPGGAAAAPAPARVAGGLDDNIAGLLCYSPVGLFADIFFLVADPYSQNRFIRFHAFQSLFTGIACCALSIAIGVVTRILFLIPVLGWIADALLWGAFSLGMLVLWVMLMIKAYQGQKYKLPFVGDFAETQANS